MTVLKCDVGSLQLAGRSYFVWCGAIGRLLRAAKYSTVQIHDEEVWKRRAVHAPVLVLLGALLMRILNTGVRLLSQHDWEARERHIYRVVYGASIRIDPEGVLVLPAFSGTTLASVLEDPQLSESSRRMAVELAVAALARFHDLGFTHGDAMAENVSVDLQRGAAHWFDFETVHHWNRSETWRRADDVRALMVTCLVRTAPARRNWTALHIADVYADEEVTRVVTATFTSVWRRSLAFHLAQASLSLGCFREVARVLRARSSERRTTPEETWRRV